MTCDLSKAAAEVGADGVLVMSPFYFKTRMTVRNITHNSILGSLTKLKLLNAKTVFKYLFIKQSFWIKRKKLIQYLNYLILVVEHKIKCNILKYCSTKL